MTEFKWVKACIYVSGPRAGDRFIDYGKQSNEGVHTFWNGHRLIENRYVTVAKHELPELMEQDTIADYLLDMNPEEIWEVIEHE